MLPFEQLQKTRRKLQLRMISSLQHVLGRVGCLFWTCSLGQVFLDLPKRGTVHFGPPVLFGRVEAFWVRSLVVSKTL